MRLLSCGCARTFNAQAFRCRTVEELVAAAAAGGGGSEGGGMKKVLGAADLVMLGVGGIIGAGVFVSTGVAARGQQTPGGGYDGAGPAVTVSFLFASLVAFLSALCYTEFATDIPLAGGAYVYISVTFGEFAAWIVGANLMLEYTLSAAAVARGWTSYLAEVFQLDPNAFRASVGSVQLDFPAALIVMALSALLSRGIREGSRFNMVVTGLNLLSIAVVLFGGFSHIEPENYTPFAPNGWRSIATAASIVFFSFIGFDTVASTAEEVKSPGRDLPIGILASLGICTVLYALMAITLTGMLPWNEIDVHAPFGQGFQALGMHWVSVLVSVGAVTGITTSLLVSLIGQARVYVTLARDHLIPSNLATIHPKYGTPLVAQMTTGALSAFLALLIDIEVLAKMVNIGTLFVFFMVAAAVYVRRYVPTTPGPTRDALARAVDWRLSAIMLTAFAFSLAANAAAAWWALLTITALGALAASTFLALTPVYAPSGFRTPLMPFTPAAAMGGTFWLIGSLGILAFVRFFIWLAASVLVYLAYGMHRSAAVLGPPPSPPTSPTGGVQLTDVGNPLADAPEAVVVEGGGERGAASRRGGMRRNESSVSNSSGTGPASPEPPSEGGGESDIDADDVALHRGPNSAAVQ